MSRANIIIILALSIATLLWLGQYALERSLILKGIDLGALQDQVKELQRQNIILQDEIYQKESLTTIAQKAKAMGFIQSNSIIYITK